MSLNTVTHSPHIKTACTTTGIMLDVIIALFPAALWGLVLFGPVVIAIFSAAVSAAVVSEYVCCKIMKKPSSIYDLSAVVTGLLLAMNMPATPQAIWMAALGSAVAIVVVKMMFGGLGQNFANPALVGRITLLVSFPVAMTTWVQPHEWLKKGPDAISSATPLAANEGEYSLLKLLLGDHAGSLGETGALFLLIGGVYLVVRRVITPTIPLAFIGTVAVMSLIFGQNPLISVLSGGVMLGAIFMATDYVTTPHNFLGRLIFGLGCGLITVVIRKFGSLPEGVSYGILLMNLLTPHIERLTARKPFGWEASDNG